MSRHPARCPLGRAARALVRDARPGESRVGSSAALRQHVDQAVRTAGRDDLVVGQEEPPAEHVV